MRHTFLSFLLTIVCLGNISQANEVTVPPFNQHITDLSNILSSEQKSHIEDILTNIEHSEGSQVAVLIVPSTQLETIENYSLRVVKKWKIGRKNIDDGVLLLIAQNDRKIRIEVGYGLEDSITDIIAGRIIKEYITPEFRRGRFYQGILAGIGQIENLIKGEALPAPTTSQGDKTNNPEPLIVMAIFGSGFISIFLAPIFGRLISALAVSLVGAGVIWLITQNTLLTIIGAAIIAIFNIGTSNAQNTGYQDNIDYSKGGGGTSNGGGFSGGGGDFGGGGASGGW